jgi:hypothetical protein
MHGSGEQMMFAEVAQLFDEIFVWALIATAAMTTILHGSQGWGLSRLSLSFLVGTFFTGKRDLANILGFVVYALGGWLFAFIYVLVFWSVDSRAWWVGSAIGFLHGLFLLTVALPLLPYIHPRLASEFDGPTAKRRLEPPGFMGLNYGYRTPLTTLIAQVTYGMILGLCYQMSLA